MKKTTLTALVLILASANSGIALAKGDAAIGQQKSQVCQACHGADGKGTNPTYPVLAGQHQDYLAQALRDYRDGSRKNPIMAGMAAALSDEDIENLAEYYASMEGLKDLSIK